MEEILVAVLQVIFELALNVFSYVPFDIPIGSRKTPEVGYGFLPAMGWLLAGGVLAGVSLLVFRHTFIHHAWVRISNLALSPVISGYVSQFVAVQRAKSDLFVIPRNHFWYAFTFSLAFVLIRFTYAARA